MNSNQNKKDRGKFKHVARNQDDREKRFWTYCSYSLTWSNTTYGGEK